MTYVDMRDGGGEDEASEVLACQRNVVKALRNSQLLKILVASLEDAGCPFSPRRHLSCEPCKDMGVSGGYDLSVNQVVICSDVCKSSQKVERILAHEMVHVYDFCTSKIDFRNRDHLACTEIR